MCVRVCVCECALRWSEIPGEEHNNTHTHILDLVYVSEKDNACKGTAMHSQLLVASRLTDAAPLTAVVEGVSEGGTKAATNSLAVGSNLKFFMFLENERTRMRARNPENGVWKYRVWNAIWEYGAHFSFSSPDTG